MSVKPKLEPHTQLAIGETLRSYLMPSWTGISPELVDLWRRVQEMDEKGSLSARQRPVATEAPPDSAPAEGPEPQCFGPEALTSLNAAFDQGWATLRSLAGANVSKERLAERILEIAADGERSPPRLATKALISVIAPGAKRA
jgi:hypothetical protein